MCACEIMISYHLSIVFALSIGTACGNFIFSGLIADQVVINRIKREIKMKMVMNTKITQHNEKITEYCNSGIKSLVKHWKEEMSLQKIQVELSMIKGIEQPEDPNEWNLAKKVVTDFKNWRNESKYIRKKKSTVRVPKKHV